jgi:hypothetical protein
MSKRRTWLWIIVGVCSILFFLGIGAVIATTAWVQQNMTLSDSTERDAEQQFDKVRALYKDRPPLIDLRNGRPVYTNGTPPAPRPSSTPLAHLNVLVWDPEDAKLAELALPMWLVRLKSGPIEFGSYASGFDDDGMQLRVEDLEAYGPGIILDATSPSGERVLLWTSH